MENLLNINGAEEILKSSLKISYYAMKKTGEIKTPDGDKKKIEFVWMALSFERTLWSKYDPDEENPKPLCRARNGKIPDEGTQKRPGPCESCQDSQWTGENNEKAPICAEVYKLLCWDIEKDAPFYLQVKRTGIKSLKNFRNDLRINGLKYRHNGFPDHLCVKCQLSSRLENTKRFADIFVPDFSIIGPIDEEKAKEFYQIAVNLSNEFKNLREEYEDSPNSLQEAPPSNVFPGQSADDAQYQKKNSKIPSLMEKDWHLCKVGFKKAGDLSWWELAQDKQLQDGSSGRAYLEKLAEWKEKPEVCEFALAVLEKFRNEEKGKMGEDCPF